MKPYNCMDMGMSSNCATKRRRRLNRDRVKCW